MGRGRGKGRKLAANNHEDTGSGEEEKIPAQKKRGRPQKLQKNKFDDEEHDHVEEEGGEDAKSGITTMTKETQGPDAVENGKKRKRNTEIGEKSSSVKEENGGGTRSSTEDSTKSNGFRHNGSRRKSKPRRAAEVGVECK